MQNVLLQCKCDIEICKRMKVGEILSHINEDTALSVTTVTNCMRKNPSTFSLIVITVPNKQRYMWIGSHPER